MAKKKTKEPGGTVAAARKGTTGGGWDRKKAWEAFKSLAGTLAIFLLLRTFLIEAYRIPSGSMIPSMLIGDWLFVNKRLINADDKLRAVFGGKNKVSMFEMTKLVSSHLK